MSIHLLKSVGDHFSALETIQQRQLTPLRMLFQHSKRLEQPALLLKGPEHILKLDVNMSAAFQAFQRLGRMASEFAGPVGRMMSQMTQNRVPSVWQWSERAGSSAIVLPTHYLERLKQTTDRLAHLESFFDDLEAIKAALDAARLKQALLLIQERLHIRPYKAEQMMRKYFRQYGSQSPQACRAAKHEAEQEILYAFITCYQDVSDMLYRELLTLGDPYAWLRRSMERTMYASLTRRGYLPHQRYAFIDSEAFFNEIGQLRDLKFDAIEAREQLEWMCAGTENKLLRLSSDTAREQLLIIQGIRSGEYLSEDEIKAHHPYPAWQAVRTKLRNFAEA